MPPQQSKSQNLTSRVHQVSTIIVPKSSPVTLVAAGDTSPDGGAAYQSVLRAFLDVIQQSAAANNKSKLTTTNVFNGLYRDYRFPNYQDGTPGCHKIPPAEVLHYNAPALLQALDKATYEKYEIYNWLQEMVNTEFHPVVFKPQDFPIHIVARQKKSAAVKPPIIIEDNIFEDDEDDVMSDTPRRGGKGVKQAGRRGGKTSGLRTVTSSKKRPLVAPESESESEPETGDFKRSHYFSEGEEDTAMDDASKATTQSHSEAPDTPQPTGDQIKVFIRAEKMPSTVPKGPDNTWTCDQEGCDHIVRGGDEDQVQARILEHFNYHEQQAKRLSLALSESRGQLPIKYAHPSSPCPFLVHQISATTITTPPTYATQKFPLAHSQNPSSPHRSPPRLTPPPLLSSPSSPVTKHVPDLSGTAHDSFHRLVEQFRRRPRPVSDRISSLTCLQSFTRQAKEDGRESGEEPAACGRGCGASRADQAETDSLTAECWNAYL